MESIYIKKNHDYGDSFTQSLDKFGIIAAVVRMEDKKNRLESLLNNTQMVEEESIVDTLTDLANYAIMTAAWLKPICCISADNYKNAMKDFVSLYDSFSNSVEDILDGSIARAIGFFQTSFNVLYGSTKKDNYHQDIVYEALVDIAQTSIATRILIELTTTQK